MQPATLPTSVAAPRRKKNGLFWGRVKILLALVFGLVVGGAAGYHVNLQSPKPGDEPKPESQSERLAWLKNFARSGASKKPNWVAALGRISPSGEVIELGGMMGDRLGKLVVAEGDEVKEGAELGYLDSRTERAAERDAASAQLADAIQRRDADLAHCDALISQAQIGVAQAKTLDPLELAAQEARVRALQGELKAAEVESARLVSGSVPEQKIDQAAQLVRRLKEDLNAAEAVRDRIKESLSLNMRRAQAELEAAKAARRKAEASAQLDFLTKSRDAAEERLKRTVLKAPRDGTVLRILTQPGERLDQKPILKMGDTSTMYAIAEVYETDVQWVKPGQIAHVSSRALPEALNGTVEKIGKMIYKNDVLHVDPAADADARVVEVWIRLNDAKAARNWTNLQVDVVIDVSDGQGGKIDRHVK